jgi:hypothetical protein
VSPRGRRIDQPRDVEFAPARPLTRRRLLVRAAIAPFLWFIALDVVAVVVHQTAAIGLGLIVAGGSLVVSFAVLSWVRARRDRDRRRYAEPG